jgi:xanthine dehydrogenase accessory factor
MRALLRSKIPVPRNITDAIAGLTVFKRKLSMKKDIAENARKSEPCLKLEKRKIKLSKLIVVIKGAGEMASAVAWRIYMSNIRRILMLEVNSPLAVRRKVSFCEAVHEKRQTVEGIEAIKVDDYESGRLVWTQEKIAVAVDPEWKMIDQVQPHVVVDAILAKKNLGTHMGEAALVIGLGPGFTAGEDVHLSIETNRGHNLGRIISIGSAERNTGIPGPIDGLTEQRVLRAPCNGEFYTRCLIGNPVKKNDTIGTVAAQAVVANIDGVLRGLIRPHSIVHRGLKIGDIDPRGNVDYCYTISDKARAIAGSVLEAILRVYN